MATQVVFPSPNMEYQLSLGASFAPEPGEEVETSYAALRYDFRPASADMEQPGVLLLGKDNRVSLYLANSATCELDVLLSGKYEPYAGGGHPTGTAQGRDCLDCVALFDPTTGSFRLEALLGQYNTKHVRDAPPYRAPVEDLMELSPGTLGSAGPGPSMSPTGAQPPQRRSDSPLASEDGAGQQQSQQQPHAGQAHDRYGGASGAAAAARNSKPPRPPGMGSAGRSVASAGGGGAHGKKRQRDSGAAGSPQGGPAKKASRLSKSSLAGAPEQARGQAKRGAAKADVAQAQQPTRQQAAGTAAATAAAQERSKAGAAAAAAVITPQAVQGPADGDVGEDDVDAELLDAFDTTFDEDLEEGTEAVAAVDTGAGAGGMNDGAAVTPVAAEPAVVAPHAGDGDAGVVAAVSTPAPALHAAAPTPTLEVAHGEEPAAEESQQQLHQHHQQEPEAAPPSPPPAARLVVEDMDDDDGYGYGGEEEYGMGLGIEYF